MSIQFVDAMLTYINGNRPDGCPPCVMDALPDKGPGMSLQMVMVPRWAKRYIDGTGTKQATFTLRVQVVPERQAQAYDWLAALGGLIAGMENVHIGNGFMVESATATTPSIISRLQDGTPRYGISCAVIFTD
jgi:hypothetical protein